MTKIKALLLAAGLGTRLYPITKDTPKCLVKVGGQTMLDRWIKSLSKAGCNDILINLHHHANKVRRHLEAVEFPGMNIKCEYEKELLGTAGTLIKNSDFFLDSTCILIHCDNATDLDLSMLLKAHRDRPKECLMTMLTFDSSNPESCGIVRCDSRGVMIEFHEKVFNPPGNQANGAIYVFGEELLNKISKMENNACDFSTQIIPKLCGQVYTFHTNHTYIDIGTLKNLAKAQRVWPN